MTNVYIKIQREQTTGTHGDLADDTTPEQSVAGVVAVTDAELTNLERWVSTGRRGPPGWTPNDLFFHVSPRQ